MPKCHAQKQQGALQRDKRPSGINPDCLSNEGLSLCHTGAPGSQSLPAQASSMCVAEGSALSIAIGERPACPASCGATVPPGAPQLQRIRCGPSLTSYWPILSRSREDRALLQVSEHWSLISDKQQTSALSAQWLNLETHYFYFLARSSHSTLKGKMFMNLFLWSHLPALTFPTKSYLE